MIITLSPEGGSPADQIRDQVRGLVSTSQLAAGQRLPSVRQLATDLGLAPGTVAKAYKALEAEGMLTTRIGGGTRVSRNATAIPVAVRDAAATLAQVSQQSGVPRDEAVRVLRALWPD